MGTQTLAGLELIPNLQWTQLGAGPEFLQGCKWHHPALAGVTKTTLGDPCVSPQVPSGTEQTQWFVGSHLISWL